MYSYIFLSYAPDRSNPNPRIIIFTLYFAIRASKKRCTMLGAHKPGQPQGWYFHILLQNTEVIQASLICVEQVGQKLEC